MMPSVPTSWPRWPLGVKRHTVEPCPMAPIAPMAPRAPASHRQQPVVSLPRPQRKSHRSGNRLTPVTPVTRGAFAEHQSAWVKWMFISPKQIWYHHVPSVLTHTQVSIGMNKPDSCESVAHVLNATWRTHLNVHLTVNSDCLAGGKHQHTPKTQSQRKNGTATSFS